MFKSIAKRTICILMSIIVLTGISAISVSADQEKETVKCSILIEASSKVIISSTNENEKVPVGTMAKLMTVYLAAQEIEEGNLKTTDIVKTSAYANTMQGAQIWLMPGEEITVDELLKGIIIGNANDASVVLAEKISGTEEKFVRKMNECAEELGMNNTVFTNCNGYYDDAEQISTAYDLAVLCAELSRYEFLTEYFTCWRDFVRNGQTELVNANELVKSYEGICGFKSGYTENSGYCAAEGAERNGTEYIAVVLGYDDKDKSIAEAKSLLNIAFTQYKVVTPELTENVPAEIPVRGGMVKTIPIGYGEIRNVVLPLNSINSISSKVIMTDYVYAPVQSGYKVGEIQFFRSDKLMFCVDIVTKGNVEEINLRKALNIIVKKLLTF